MRLEVLVSCMGQEDFSIVAKSRLTGDVLIINQCRENKTLQAEDGVRRIRMISTTERGLSNSRNMALTNSDRDICLLCDDDETFVSGYEELILGAFASLPDADIIVFDMQNQPSRLGDAIQRLGFFSYLHVCSWQIAFRRESILKSGVRFDPLMGAGTGNGGGEEVNFLMDCHRSGLRVYHVPTPIASVAQSASTWFHGYDKSFFYQRGTATRHMLGLPLSTLYAVYYAIAKRPLYRGEITPWAAFSSTMRGIFRNDIRRQAIRRQL